MRNKASLIATMVLLLMSALSRAAFDNIKSSRAGRQGLNEIVESSSCPNPPIFPYLPPPNIPTDDPTLVATLETIQEQLNQQWYEDEIPCLSLVIVYNGETLLNISFGYANPAEGRLADSNTLYRIASNTKIFTTMMLFKMRDEGLVTLDTPITTIEPRYQPMSNFKGFATNRVGTLGQLACHTAGLFDESPCDLNDTNCTSEVIYQRLKNESLILPPNYRPSYSNFGFAILGRSLQNLLPNNQTYEEWVVQNLLQSIGMNSSGFEITPEVVARMALGSGNSSDFLPPDWTAPNGAMYSSANDLAKFMNMMMDTETDNGLFDPVTISEMTQARYVFYDGQSAQGMPWEMRLIGNYWARTKDGNYNGFSSNVAIVPELKLGVTFLSNACCLDSSQYVDPILELMIPLMGLLCHWWRDSFSHLSSFLSYDTQSPSSTLILPPVHHLTQSSSWASTSNQPKATSSWWTLKKKPPLSCRASMACLALLFGWVT
eukprot:TRINITY_DN6217_c0_g1_i2.p1 TRINITY_DN6217_c0_g1~~TRINITY_DN6217_c0_g1_i2.p1  ORF type:complete len:489 (-),score=80.12 TRINITY_DN6217_c0_g1_i2:276-1742(-)